jgi:hypothetical protein
MEDLANRIAEISHMSRCTPDIAVYRPTLKIIFHLRVLSRLQHSYGIPICSFAGTYSEASGPYSKDCRPYTDAEGRIRKTADRIRKPADVFREQRKPADLFREQQTYPKDSVPYPEADGR